MTTATTTTTTATTATATTATYYHRHHHHHRHTAARRAARAPTTYVLRSNARPGRAAVVVEVLLVAPDDAAATATANATANAADADATPAFPPPTPPAAASLHEGAPPPQVYGSATLELTLCSAYPDTAAPILAMPHPGGLGAEEAQELVSRW